MLLNLIGVVFIDPNPISVTIGARDQAKQTGVFGRRISKLRMGWPIRPEQFYMDLDIARNIRKFFRLVYWTPITQMVRTGLVRGARLEQNTSKPTSSQPIRRCNLHVPTQNKNGFLLLKLIKCWLPFLSGNFS